MIFIKCHANHVTSLLKSLAPSHPHNKAQISQQGLQNRPLGVQTQAHLTASCLCNEPNTIRLCMLVGRSTSFTHPMHYCEVPETRGKKKTPVFLKLNVENSMFNPKHPEGVFNERQKALEVI